MSQMVGRMVLFAALSVLISLGLAWVVEQVPSLGWVLTAVFFAFVALTIYRIMRAPQPLLAIAAVAGTFVLAVGLATVVAVLTDGDDEAEAASTGAGPDEVADEEASPDAAETTSTTAAADADDEPEGEDGDAAGSTSSTTSTTSSTTSPPAPTFAFTDPTDCGCPDEITGVTFTPGADGLRIDLAGDAPLSGPLMVWDLGAPGRIAFVDIAPAEPGVLSGVLAAPGPGPWAIVSPGLDRAPDLGFLDDANTLRTVSEQGSEAATIEAAVAEVQRLAPGLPEAVQPYVASLLDRQIGEGTSTLRQVVDGQADVEVLVTVANQYPAAGQVVAADGAVIGRSHLTPTEQIRCAPDGAGGLGCDVGAYPQTLTAAQAVVTNPDGLVVEALAPPEGRPDVSCLRIVAAPEGGPSLGDTCWDADGRFVSLVRSTDTVTLESFTPTVDPAVLLAPEVG